jgi:hypothetical protein
MRPAKDSGTELVTTAGGSRYTTSIGGTRRQTCCRHSTRDGDHQSSLTTGNMITKRIRSRAWDSSYLRRRRGPRIRSRHCRPSAPVDRHSPAVDGHVHSNILELRCGFPDAFCIGHILSNDLKHALCVLRRMLKLCCGGAANTRHPSAED